MTKSKNGGRRHRVRTAITPKRIVKALVVIDGVKRILDTDVINLLKVHMKDPKQVTSNPTAAIKVYAERILPGAAEIVLGPKAIDQVAKLLTKGEPMIGKLANKKLMTI